MRSRPEQFDGLFAVTVTPFSDDGSTVLDEGVGQLCTAIMADGVEHLIPCGNTGEYLSLTADERRRIVSLTLEAVGDRAWVSVGVGGALLDAIRECRHAEDVGATAIMIHHPPQPYVTEEGYLHYVASISASTALPVMPYLRGPILGDDGIRRLIDMPAVVGVKFAYNDLLAFAQAVTIGIRRPELAWICGTAESWAPFFWAVGAVGFTSGLANVSAVHSLDLLAALRRGDRATAMAIWRRLRPFEAMRSRYRDGLNVAVVKEALRQIGRPSGPVRPPASDLGPEERKEIAGLLTDWADTTSGAPDVAQP